MATTKPAAAEPLDDGSETPIVAVVEPATEPGSAFRNVQPFPIRVAVPASTKDAPDGVDHVVVQPGEGLPDGVNAEELGRLAALNFIRP